MKSLIAALLVSMSGLCFDSGVTTTAMAVVNNAHANSAVVGGGAAGSADPKMKPEWCTCALSVEETIFLQQYDLDSPNTSGDRP